MAPPARQTAANRYLAIASRSSSSISSHSDTPLSAPMARIPINPQNEAPHPHFDPRPRAQPRKREATDNSDTTASSFQSPYKSPHDASIFVGNLPPDLDDLDLVIELRSHFNTVTSVQHVKIVPDPRNNSRCAFIQVENAEEVQKAINVLSGQEFRGYPLRCELARAHRSLLLSIRHPNDLEGLDKIEWVRLRRNHGDRTVHVGFGAEDKEKPSVTSSSWTRKDPLQGSGLLVSFENLFNEGREQTIKILGESFGSIERFGRFVADDPATVFDPHPRPGAWLHDPRDEQGPSTEDLSNSHPRGPWEIKYERRNDSVSAFMALKQIPLFNISRTHTHRPADLSFLASGKVDHKSQPIHPTTLYTNVHLPSNDVIVDDRRPETTAPLVSKKTKGKRMRRGGGGISMNAQIQAHEEFPPLGKPEAKKSAIEEPDTGARKAQGAWNSKKEEVSEASSPKVPDNAKTGEQSSQCAVEESPTEKTQKLQHQSSRSLESLIFDSSDSESVHKIGNVLGLSVNSTRQSQTSRKPKKALTCVFISSKITIAGERWDETRLVVMFSGHSGFRGVQYKVKRKSTGLFTAHVEFETEEQAKAAYEVEKEHQQLGKQLKLAPGCHHPAAQLSAPQRQPAPEVTAAPDTEPIVKEDVCMEPQDEPVDLSPALSSTLQAESPRPSTARTDEMDNAQQQLLDTTPCTPSTHPFCSREPEVSTDLSYMEEMVIEVSETTVDEDDGVGGASEADNELESQKVVTEDQTKTEESLKNKKGPSEANVVEGEQALLEGVSIAPESVLARSIPSTPAPGLLFGVGQTEVGSKMVTGDSLEPPFVRRRTLSDSHHLGMNRTSAVFREKNHHFSDDNGTASAQSQSSKVSDPPPAEWCDSEIQAASPPPVPRDISPVRSEDEPGPPRDPVSSTGSGRDSLPSGVLSTLSPFGALVYVPPPFDSNVTGTSARHFTSPAPAKGFVETPHGLLPIYPAEVLQRFGPPASVYFHPQYPPIPQAHLNPSQPWHQQPPIGGPWPWGRYLGADYPYHPPDPSHSQPPQATALRTQHWTRHHDRKPGEETLEPTEQHPQTSPSNHGGRRGSFRGSYSRRHSRPSIYTDPSPGSNGANQAIISPQHTNQSQSVSQYSDGDCPLQYPYHHYHPRLAAPRASIDTPSSYTANNLQAHHNVYQQYQHPFNQQDFSHPFHLHPQHYQHLPPPFNPAYTFPYSQAYNDVASVPSTQFPDHHSQSYSVT